MAVTLKRLVRQWRKFGDHTVPKFRGFDQWGTQHAARERDSIGWCQLLLGRIALKLQLPTTPHRFLAEEEHGAQVGYLLVQKALDVAWDVWEQRDDVTLHPR